jgi:cell wall-associated NlpC family hydrolase
MMDVLTSLDHYRSIPWVQGGRDLKRDKGLDCWGLARMVCHQLTGVELPADDSEAMARMGELCQVLDDTRSIRAGDLVTMQRGLHVGVCIGEHVLHSSKTSGVQLVSVAVVHRQKIAHRVLRPRRQA